MPELSSVFSLVNYAFVLFFGIVAALYFADIGFCDHKRVYVLTLFFFGIACPSFLCIIFSYYSIALRVISQNIFSHCRSRCLRPAARAMLRHRDTRRFRRDGR